MRWIIGVPLILFALAVLSYFVLRKVLNGGHPHRPYVEINQMHEAIQGYKEKHLSFPPCMAEDDLAVRKTRFMQHLTYAHPYSEYGTGEEAFDRLNEKIRTEWNNNFRRRGGTLAPLDLERLDAAESLVFWLGGFPSPYDSTTRQPIHSRKVIGFHKSMKDPFRQDVTTRETAVKSLEFRTIADTFRFDESRLVDNDDDGWLEYAPFPGDEPELRAPFVYFDSATYLPTTKHRQSLGGCFFPHDPKLAAAWGTAVPYALAYDPQSPEKSTWANPISFQIVSAGIDGKYGPVGDGQSLPPRRIVVYEQTPKTFTESDGFQQPRKIDVNEADNLTNLSTKPIGTGRPPASP